MEVSIIVLSTWRRELFSKSEIKITGKVYRILSFLQIPYVIMLFAAGLPVFFLEICLGQYAGVGPIKIFGRIAPIIRGLGYVSFATLKNDC